MKDPIAEAESGPRRSAILLARDAQGRVLLVRQRGGPFRGAWLLPGGGLEAGESFEDAVRREVREETCLEAHDVRLVARYDVKTSASGAPAAAMRVHMFRGSVAGEPRVGLDGEPVEWRSIVEAEAHPVLLRQLRDAGASGVAEEAVAHGLAERGIRMTPLAVETSG